MKTIQNIIKQTFYTDENGYVRMVNTNNKRTYDKVVRSPNNNREKEKVRKAP